VYIYHHLSELENKEWGVFCEASCKRMAALHVDTWHLSIFAYLRCSGWTREARNSPSPLHLLLLVDPNLHQHQMPQRTKMQQLLLIAAAQHTAARIINAASEASTDACAHDLRT